MGGAMSDLLSDARDLRQKLYRLEVLLQIEGAGEAGAGLRVRLRRTLSERWQ